MEIFMPAIFLIILLLLILWYIWRKFRQLKKKLRRDVGETEAAMHEVFHTLRENMEEQIRLLESTKMNRELTSEEMKIFRQLKRDLKVMEEFLTDEIERLEKNTK